MKKINLSNTDVRILMNDVIYDMEREEVKDALIECSKNGYIYNSIDDFAYNYIVFNAQYSIFNDPDNYETRDYEGFKTFRSQDDEDLYFSLDTGEAYDHCLSVLLDKADIEDLKDIIDNVEILESAKSKILKEISER